MLWAEEGLDVAYVLTGILMSLQRGQTVGVRADVVTPMLQDSHQCSQKAKGLVLRPGGIDVDVREVVAPNLACECDLEPVSLCYK